MSQQRLGAANQARAEAKAEQMSAIGDMSSGATQIATAGMSAPKGGSEPLDLMDYSKMSPAGNQFADSSTIFPTGGSTDYTYGFGNTPQYETPFPKKRKKK